MSRKFIKLFVAAFLGCLVVGSTIAWSNIPRPADGPAYVAATDVDQPSAPAVTPRVDIPLALRTKADFDQAFADLTGMQRPENTPAYREKLRRVGWTRIIGSR
jgi:hypothetical protein